MGRWSSNIFLLLVITFATSTTPCLGVDVVFNSFESNDLIFSGDARVDSSVIRLTNNSKDFSIGRAFYPFPFLATASYASVSFVFSILPQTRSTPGFGFAFVVANTTVPSGNSSGQYFGLFSDKTVPSSAPAPLTVIEFDTGQNPELYDLNNNHIGVNLNSAYSLARHEAGYFNSTTEEFVPIDMRSGNNIQAWIEFDAVNVGINVTIAPVGVPKPSKPLISIFDPTKLSYKPATSFFGFSACRYNYVEEQRILAWSLSNVGPARDINTSNLQVFNKESSLTKTPSSSSLSSSIIAGIVIISIVVPVLLLSVTFWFWIKKRRHKKQEENKIQDWEIEYWPHGFSYEELLEATKGFSKDVLLGSGGFGKVYKGILSSFAEVAVKCVNHDSNQGLREFMAEISSIGRLQHKNLVHMRGWCKRGQELMLVYAYMPNGSLSSWIFGNSKNHLGWETRRKVLMDVAEALNYLHHGWHHLVLHRDIKSSNILLDSNMRGRIGDFGLAKLYKHGQVPTTTRLVGTIGYMAPELVTMRATTASDVYSFGVLVLEVACGRRPMEGEPILIHWVRQLHAEGRLCEAADSRIAGEYEVDDMEMMLNLGLTCCDSDPKLRPTMKEVAAVLTNSGQPGSSSTDYMVSEHNLRSIAAGGGGGAEISTTSDISDLSPRT